MEIMQVTNLQEVVLAVQSIWLWIKLLEVVKFQLKEEMAFKEVEAVQEVELSSFTSTGMKVPDTVHYLLTLISL